MVKSIIPAYMKDINIDDYFDISQFSLVKQEKTRYMNFFINKVHQFHYNHSFEYQKLTNNLFNNIQYISKVEELPFLPVSLFKQYTLKSIPDDKIYKVITSSGTSGSIPSRVYLDSETARLQTKALSKILTHILGQERLPMLIVDSKSILYDRNSFSARGAGILGLSVFGKNHSYLLDEKLTVDDESFKKFISLYNGKRILIFGFTFMIWKFLFLENHGFDVDLSNAILIHSGGWKRMQEMSVDNTEFKKKLNEKFNLKHVYNFYGMAEQVGSVFLENSDGYLHCGNYSDILIRNPYDFSLQTNGKEGLIQVISILPHSYPGHSILTEDIGTIMGEDNSSNGWKGKYFKISGRTRKAEIRGCSDTF